MIQGNSNHRQTTMVGQKRGISIQQKAHENGCSPSERCDMARVTVDGITESGQKTWERRGCRCYSSSLSSIYTFDGSDTRHWSYRRLLPPTRRLTYVSKCWPRLGSARRFAMVLRTLLSGRMTMTGTGEWLRQYLATDASDQQKTARKAVTALTWTRFRPPGLRKHLPMLASRSAVHGCRRRANLGGRAR